MQANIEQNEEHRIKFIFSSAKPQELRSIPVLNPKESNNNDKRFHDSFLYYSESHFIL